MTAAKSNRCGHSDASTILMIAAKRNRYGHRDAPMILQALRHGLRACELVDLECSQVDFKAATLHVPGMCAGRRRARNRLTCSAATNCGRSAD
jgi:integrase